MQTISIPRLIIRVKPLVVYIYNFVCKPSSAARIRGCLLRVILIMVIGALIGLIGITCYSMDGVIIRVEIMEIRNYK